MKNTEIYEMELDRANQCYRRLYDVFLSVLDTKKQLDENHYSEVLNEQVYDVVVNGIHGEIKEYYIFDHNNSLNNDNLISSMSFEFDIETKKINKINYLYQYCEVALNPRIKYEANKVLTKQILA